MLNLKHPDKKILENFFLTAKNQIYVLQEQKNNSGQRPRKYFQQNSEEKFPHLKEIPLKAQKTYKTPNKLHKKKKLPRTNFKS